MDWKLLLILREVVKSYPKSSKNNKMKIPLESLLMLLSLTCYGEQWDSVVSNDNDTTFFFDPNSVKKTGDFVQYWELTNYKEKLMSGKIVVSSSKSLVEIDCKNNRYRNIQVIDYEREFGLGGIVNVDISGEKKWYSSPKESVSSVMERKMCSLKTKL